MSRADSSVIIRGTLVGGIWWPAGAECWKPLRYDATAGQRRTVGKMTLRDHVLSATNDGDFQSCRLADATLEITTRHGSRTRSRIFPLDMFPSVVDCILPDWGGPAGDWED